MRNVIKIALVLGAALALFGSQALAEVGFGVQVKSVFGQASTTSKVTVLSTDGTTVNAVDESGGTSGLSGDHEGNLNMSGSSESVSMKLRYRVRGDAGATLKTHRSLLAWKINDAMKLELHGRSFGLSSMAVGYVGAAIGRHSIGDDAAYIGWEDATGINFEMNLGAATAGLAIFDTCRPACGQALNETTSSAALSDTGLTKTAGVSNGTANGSVNPMTVVVHANGAAGPIKWGFQYDIASAQVADKTSATAGATTSITDTNIGTSGSGMELGVKWAGPATVGFTYATNSSACVTYVAGAATASADTCKDTTGSAMSLGVNMAGAGLKFTTKSSEGGFGDGVLNVVSKTSSTAIDISYGMAIAPGVTAGPDIRTVSTSTEYTNDATGTAISSYKNETSAMLISYAINGSF